jgi:hypothetical protein
MKNDQALLSSVLSMLAERSLNVWVFGGRAEELWQIGPPRAHNDIDLLYPAAGFDRLDEFMREPGLEEIPAKRFSHKRALVYQGVMVDIFLLQRSEDGYGTQFFDGLFNYRWPLDTLSYTRTVCGSEVNVASVAALMHFRANHQRISQAREIYSRTSDTRE